MYRIAGIYFQEIKTNKCENSKHNSLDVFQHIADKHILTFKSSRASGVGWILAKKPI
jgi:hypothetical protein